MRHVPTPKPPPGDPWWDTNGVFGAMPDGVELLTREDIDRLRVGVRVGVLWEGGNGPHEYVVLRDRWDQVYFESVHRLQLNAMAEPGSWHTRPQGDPLDDRIGPRTTRVWIINDRQPVRKPKDD